jgi:hypothetical protein
MEFREAIERDAQDLRGLAHGMSLSGEPFCADLLGKLTACANDYAEQERLLEAAAMDLRRTWLARAHGSADGMLKSPREGKVAHLPSGDVRYGYERDLDASLLEDRGDSYLLPPPGWSGDLVLYRSGQAALACILPFAVARWGTDRALTIAHAGAYFETTDLLDSWPQRVLRKVDAASCDSADIVIVEPVWCDGRFGACENTPRARHVVLIDTTMVGPGHDLSRHIPGRDEPCDLVIAYSSGLKLDQAGLELANVGIVRVLSRDGGDRSSKVAEELRRIRGLTGSGLTLDELSALSAPCFMDRGYADRYTTAIFANNSALAHAIGNNSAVFAEACHPALLAHPLDGPFCALQLHEASEENYRRLATIVERECRRRDLQLTTGGSFGFRGHRVDLIEPEPQKGSPFLRIAMGWRAGHSLAGICALFAELSRQPSFSVLQQAYGR